MYINLETSDRLTHQQAKNVAFYFLAEYYTPEEVMKMESGEIEMTPLAAEGIQAYKQELILDLQKAATLLQEADDRVTNYINETVQDKSNNALEFEKRFWQPISEAIETLQNLQRRPYNWVTINKD